MGFTELDRSKTLSTSWSQWIMSDKMGAGSLDSSCPHSWVCICFSACVCMHVHVWHMCVCKLTCMHAACMHMCFGEGSEACEALSYCCCSIQLHRGSEEDCVAILSVSPQTRVIACPGLCCPQPITAFTLPLMARLKQAWVEVTFSSIHVHQLR